MSSRAHRARTVPNPPRARFGISSTTVPKRLGQALRNFQERARSAPCSPLYMWPSDSFYAGFDREIWNYPRW